MLSLYHFLCASPFLPLPNVTSIRPFKSAAESGINNCHFLFLAPMLLALISENSLTLSTPLLCSIISLNSLFKSFSPNAFFVFSALAFIYIL
jgi:hypothetical protein